jgi:hypothetical protein
VAHHVSLWHWPQEQQFHPNSPYFEDRAASLLVTIIVAVHRWPRFTT